MTKNDIPIHDFASEDARTAPFQVLPLSYKSGYDPSIPHRHNYYEIFLFREGGGIHDIDFEKVPIHDHSLHFVSPGQVHEVRRAADSSGIVLLFSREFFYLSPGGREFLFDHPLLNNNHPFPSIDLEGVAWERIWSLAQEVKREWEGEAKYREELIRLRLKLILVEAREKFEALAGAAWEGKDGLFKSFRMLLEQQFRSLHLVKEYAAELGSSEKSLNEAVKKAQGKTASEMIHDRIILEAKRLLLHSDHSAKEIAHFLYFDDPSHFSKFFRSKVGRSPSSFREWVRLQYAND